MKEKVVTLFLKYPKIFVFYIFTFAIIVCAILLYRFEESVLETNSIQDAKLFAQAISSFRTLYTSEVISKVQANTNLEITHEYKNNPHGIPLPASFSTLVGEEISKNMNGSGIQLYSPYPFPWRKETGGLKDDFQKKAWETFSKKTDVCFYKFVTDGNLKYIRYAVPDLMRESCVHCHNTHAQSPKRGWKTGDLRGILEIKRPVHTVNASITSTINQTMTQLTAIVLAFLGVIYFLIIRLHDTNSRLDRNRDLISAQQEELVHASRLSALGEMAGGVAHEINTPLGILKLFTGQLKREIQEVPDVTRMSAVLEKIDQTIDRITKIVEGMRMLSRDGSLDPFHTLSVKEIVEDVATLVKEKFRNQDTVFRLQEISSDLKIECRSVEIGQVILNLLNNAYDAVASLSEKWVEIKAQKIDNKIQIIITDSGKGIPKEISSKVFDPFFTTKEVGKGTGIGLSISNRIIKSHNGTLKINHDCPNTQFVITLPASP